MLKLNCIEKSQAFHNGGGIFFVWINRMTHLLSVMMISGWVALDN